MSNQQGKVPAKHQNQSKNSPAPAEVVERFLDNQSRELELRARELDLKKQADKHHFEYAQAALSAQAQDRESSRTTGKSVKRYQYILAGAVVLIVFGFLTLALFLDKDPIAMEIIKAVVYLLSGGAGGYAVAKSTKSSSSETESAPEE